MPRFARRIATRAALLFAVAVAVTCSDAGITGPGGRALRTLIGFAPTFSKAASEVLQNLEAFSFSIDNIHIRLTRADGTVAADTVVQLNGSDSVAIALSVPVDGQTETFVAHVELRDGNTVLFAGDQTVVASKSALPSAPPPPLAVEYTGPGATVTSLDFAPADTTIFATDTLPLRPTAQNSSGQPVTNLAFVWTVRDATIGSVSAQGVFKPAGPRGQTYVIGRIPTGVKDSSLIHVLPPATHAVVVSGGGQTGTAGQKLSQQVVVELLAADNLPVPGVPVTIAASGGGSTSPATATSDALGRVAFDWTLGATAGANTAVVTSAGVTPLSIAATGVPGVAAGIGAANTLTMVDTAGAIVATSALPAILVHDANQNLVPGAQVKFRRHGGAGAALNGVADTMVIVASGADGRAALTSRRLQEPAGLDTVLVTVDGVNDTVRFVAKATNAHPHHLMFHQQPASTTAATMMTVAVKVMDQFNNVNFVGEGASLPVSLSFAGNIAIPVGAQLGPVPDSATRTAVSGVATFHVSINYAPYTYALTAAAGSIGTAMSNAFNISLGPPAFVMVDSGDGQGAILNDSLPQRLVARVVDAGLNGLSGQTIAFTADSGGGLVYTPSATTDAGGRARTAWRVGSIVGQPQVLRAALSSSLFAKFHAFVAETLVVVQQPTLDPQSGITLPQQPVAQLRDLAGHQVKRAGISVEAFVSANASGPNAVVSGDTIVGTGADGNARYQSLAINGVVQTLKLQFVRLNGAPDTTVIKYGESQNLNLRAGPASLVAAVDDTLHYYATSGSAPFRVKVTDFDGNIVPDSTVLFSFLRNAGCTLSGDGSARSDASGYATITVNHPSAYGSCAVKAQLAHPYSPPPPPCPTTCEVLVSFSTSTVFDRSFVAPVGTAIWLGSAGSYWGDAANWSTATAPTSATDVYLPTAAVSSPQTYNISSGFYWNVFARDVHADRGVTVEQYSSPLYDTLRVYGNFSVDTVSGYGAVWIAPTGVVTNQSARGFVHGKLVVGDGICASGNTLLLSDTLGGRQVEFSCKVALSKNVLYVTDAGFLTSGPGGVVMTNPEDVAVFDGAAEFHGSGSVLTNGRMYFRGDFTVVGDFSVPAFNASSTHESIFDGTYAQGIKFNNPAPDLQQFARLTIANVNADVSLLMFDPLASTNYTIPAANLVLRDKAKFTLGTETANKLIFSPTLTLGGLSVLTVWGDMRGVPSCTKAADATINVMGTGVGPTNCP